AVLAGFDWGARSAAVVAALWPERCKALVSVGGYLVVDLEANLQPLPPATEHAWWYQYYFATERGRAAMERKDLRHDLTRLVW
ncbi:alpha/beta fold hydrolase, partial [Actinomadura kijaniata]